MKKVDEYGGHSCFNDEIHHEEEEMDLVTVGLIVLLIVGIFAGIVIINHFGLGLITN